MKLLAVNKLALLVRPETFPIQLFARMPLPRNGPFLLTADGTRNTANIRLANYPEEEYFAFWVLFFGGFFVGSALIRAVLLSFGSCSVMNL